MKIILVAGGTGGHITPAIAFGDSRKKAGDRVCYVCGSRSIEKSIYESHHVHPLILPIEGSPLGKRTFKSVVERSWGMIKSIVIMYEKINKIKPDCMVLFGGYISFPALVVSKIMKIPVFIHEQNVVAGKVARIASIWKVPVAMGWRKCRGITGTYTGIPVRDFRKLSRESALNELGLIDKVDSEDRIIVVFGGSLGSSSLIDLVTITLSMVEFARCFFIVLGADKDRLDDKVAYFSSRWDMSPIYGVADMVICRSGGATLAEIGKLGIPAVVIPWEKASDGHQYENALSFLDDRESGRIWSPEMGVSKLIKVIDELENGAFRKSDRKDSGLKNSTDDDDAASALWRLILSHI
ncbi:UDP-N-acetylglucosamine--N-acetylmuramyl-(pentapeptide) pyrophosphoryl-undecaprenol N-acetylglucosamine transferase [Dethiosulfovibrio sp. F2B]|uniref:UDP-N-acetylglucosamine--N-acetylmuramyl- (pentapeptide) pyrophosphoryl-undecaprenol N-acetylglucosamine transferase n=1 Tax=Dethiosulfovibrio faecalis TaxID=2720018 RepID=UPI001F3D1BA7|nr:UDP-N-acetylglucosamine--N-acetylmuramyl-(pentapeptide) pyrophosphoryl-undecaprenol N-acetylglucosamine transferase [Dethiosulfovibrio faecalis]MCF4150528.1 UDP-N-acetylglucosamine--N-acetylmuramyl-(pentapeptide) pyrophosphoryl-undecaprenol N-acetylglucosamine transferase [Dethiosulfovibrio faecalis]